MVLSESVGLGGYLVEGVNRHTFTLRLNPRCSNNKPSALVSPATLSVHTRTSPVKMVKVHAHC